MLRYFLLLAILSNFAFSDELTVAVASNFVKPMRDLSNIYQVSTNQSITIVSGSSAKLMAQIKQGAPYDLFFSADQEKVSKLIEYGLADTASRQQYTKGRLVLWSAQCMSQSKAAAEPSSYRRLVNNDFNHLAIANPILAPYGRASVESLKSLTLYSNLKSKLVYGENIAQTYQFVYSANSDLGLVALSQVIEYLPPSPSSSTLTEKNDSQKRLQCAWLVPEHLHSPIIQEAVVVKGKNENAAQKFLDFMVSDKIQQRLLQYGYESF